MKSLLPILFLCGISHTQAIEQYTKLSIHHIITQPKFVKIGDVEYYLGLDSLGLEIESGLRVFAENSKDFINIGITHWDSDGNGLYDTKRTEVFYDYTKDYGNAWYGKVGAGIRIYGETGVEIKRLTYPNTYKIPDILTARFEVGKDLGDYSIFISHHSQWLKGRPFSDAWEYYTTSVGFYYEF
jgi:hypothetical protein